MNDMIGRLERMGRIRENDMMIGSRGLERMI